MRFPGATHRVITVSGHHTKRGWAELARQRLQEQIAPLGVELNLEKTRMVNMLNGEAFGFLGFDLRCLRNLNGDGHFILMTPKKKARNAVESTTTQLNLTLDWLRSKSEQQL